MVIHHDKMAYGKIKPLNEDIDQSRLAAMVKQLSAAEEEPDKVAHAEEDERRAASTSEVQKDGKKA